MERSNDQNPNAANTPGARYAPAVVRRVEVRVSQMMRELDTIADEHAAAAARSGPLGTKLALQAAAKHAKKASAALQAVGYAEVAGPAMVEKIEAPAAPRSCAELLRESMMTLMQRPHGMNDAFLDECRAALRREGAL